MCLIKKWIRLALTIINIYIIHTKHQNIKTNDKITRKF